MRISQQALQLIVGIDFELLRKQKLGLLESNLDEELLNGLLSLIDSIQDFAVDVMGKDENQVFKLDTLPTGQSFELEILPPNQDEPESPQGEKVYDEEQEWNVPVCRIGYGHMLMAVSARSESEAIEKALDEAGGELFSEKSSEYTAPDGAHLITDQNK